MKRKTILIICISVVILAAAVIALVFFIGGSDVQKPGSTESLGPENTKYQLDESGKRLVNVPSADYAGKCRLPKKHTTVEGLLPNNNYISNTELIQNAINTLSKDGGGTIYIPEGEFYVTQIVLKDNITLFIDPNCILNSVSGMEYFASEDKYNAVIKASDAKNVEVTGGGTINGWGESFADDAETPEPLYALKTFNLYTRVTEAEKRLMNPKDGAACPRLLSFYKCSNVSVSSITLSDSADCALRFSNCKDVSVSELVVDGNLCVRSSSGIEIAGSSNVSIDHCFIASCNDGIRLNSKNRKLLNISVSDCEVCSFGNCFKIGDETNFNIQNISLKDCSFFIPGGVTGGFAGLAIESADGSKISKVEIADIEMDGVSSPLLIWLGDRLDLEKKEVGSIHDVRIRNVKASNIEMPCVITGCEKKNVYDIKLSDFDLKYRESGEELDVRSPSVEKALSSFPEITNVSAKLRKTSEKSLFYSLPAYGLFIRHADGDSVSVENFNCAPRSCSTLEMIAEEDTAHSRS